MSAFTEDIKRYEYSSGNWGPALIHRIAAIFLPSLQATAIYRLGFYAHKMHHGVVRYGLLVLYYILNYTISWLCWGVDISPYVNIGPGLRLVRFGSIFVAGEVVIGANAKIYNDVTIGYNNGKCPKIGNNVTIYPGAKIFGDIKIGDNAVIGANAVVNKDVPENTIIAAPDFVTLEKKRS